MRYKSKHKTAAHGSLWMVRSVVLLSCLFLISTYTVSDLYARYCTAGSGTDSARVAQFSPNFTSGPGIIVSDKKAGYTDTLTFTVQNSDAALSEVAMKYTIGVKTTGNLPLEFRLLDSSSNLLGTRTCSGTEGAREYQYTHNSFVFDAGTAESRNYTLQMEWPADKNDGQFSGMTDAVYLSVAFEQID